jgi:hypothetical protein
MNLRENWRLFGQDQYLRELELVFRSYRASSNSPISDHCEFCSRKFAESAKGPDVLTEGYATRNGFRWICSDCFEDFKDEFQWRVSAS